MYHGHGIKFFGCGVKSCHCVSYTRHYKPRLVYFYPIFHCRLYCRAVCISKKGNSSICGPKINQSIIYNLSKISEFYHNQDFKLQTLQYYELIICGYLSQAVASLLWSFHNWSGHLNNCEGRLYTGRVKKPSVFLLFRP